MLERLTKSRLSRSVSEGTINLYEEIWNGITSQLHYCDMRKGTVRLVIMSAVLLNIFLLPINVAPMPALALATLSSDTPKHPAECRVFLQEVSPLD